MARRRRRRGRRAARGPTSCGSTPPSARSRCATRPCRPRSWSSRSSTRSRRSPGRVFTRDMLLDAHLGRLRLPRPAHDRRPHPPPAREDRARPQGAGVPLHGPRRRLPLPRPRSLGAESRADALADQPAGAAVRRDRARRDRRSSTLYVVPPLQRAARRSKLDELLAQDAPSATAADLTGDQRGDRRQAPQRPSARRAPTRPTPRDAARGQRRRGGRHLVRASTRATRRPSTT